MIKYRISSATDISKKYIHIDEMDKKKLRAIRRKIFNMSDEDIENAFGENADYVEWDMLERPSDITIDILLLLKYNLADGEDYQLLGDDSIMVANPDDNRWAQVRQDLF